MLICLSWTRYRSCCSQRTMFVWGASFIPEPVPAGCQNQAGCERSLQVLVRSSGRFRTEVSQESWVCIMLVYLTVGGYQGSGWSVGQWDRDVGPQMCLHQRACWSHAEPHCDLETTEHGWETQGGSLIAWPDLSAAPWRGPRCQGGSEVVTWYGLGESKEHSSVTTATTLKV